MKLPHTVNYTDEVKHGDATMFRIRINPRSESHGAIYAHEYTHVKQWYLITFIGAFVFWLLGFFITNLFYVVIPITMLFHGLLYRYVRKYRLWSEVRAFRAQIDAYPPELRYLDYACKTLAENYDLNITKTDALRLILNLRSVV